MEKYQSPTHRQPSLRNNEPSSTHTAEDQLVYACPSIAEQLPVVFESGSTLFSFSGRCAKCGNHIFPQNFRGKINRSFPKVAVITAVGVCGTCEKFTRFHYRIKDDLSFSCLRDGRWVIWQSTQSMSSRFSGWLLRMITAAAGFFLGAALYLMAFALNGWRALRWLFRFRA